VEFGVSIWIGICMQERSYHHEEAVGVNGTDKSSDDEAVPALVRLVHQGIGGVCQEKRDGDHAHVLEGDLVVLVGLFLGF
jgi:hypothetical protein